MDVNALIHKINLIIEDAFLLEEQYDKKQARQLVKDVKFIEQLVNRLIREANTTMEISNIQDNVEVGDDFTYYLETLLEAQNLVSKVSEYTPKSEAGYRLYIKDIITYAYLFTKTNDKT